MKEADEMRAGMLALSKEGHMVFRANVGKGWTSSHPPIRATSHPVTVTLMPGDVVLRAARPLSTGLPTGFSDTFGYTHDLRPYFIEWKSKTGKTSPDQETFLAAMRARGAIAGVARSVDDAQKLLR